MENDRPHHLLFRAAMAPMMRVESDAMLQSHRYKPSISRGLPFGGRLAWGAATAASAVIALVSYRYLIGTGPVAPGVAANHHTQPWLVVHVAGAATALLVGPLQFRAGLRDRWPAAHRITGRVYAAGCLCGGTAALVLARGTFAGPVAGLGFAALGTAWLATTAAGVGAIRRGKVEAHRRWMIRSVSLTFAAVTLRIYLPISGLCGFEFLSAYRAIAWLCWVPNVLVAEWIIAHELHAKPTGLRMARSSRSALPKV